jgi:hypothetical protein
VGFRKSIWGEGRDEVGYFFTSGKVIVFNEKVKFYNEPGKQVYICVSMSGLVVGDSGDGAWGVVDVVH